MSPWLQYFRARRWTSGLLHLIHSIYSLNLIQRINTIRTKHMVRSLAYFLFWEIEASWAELDQTGTPRSD